MPAMYASMSRSSSGRSQTRSPFSSGRSGIGGVASFVTVVLLCCDELPEHAVESSWMDERHAAVRSRARFRIDELSLGGGQRREILAQVAGTKADMVQPLPVPRQEASDATGLVGRFDELDPSRWLGPGSEEDDAYRLVRHRDRPLDRFEAKQLAITGQGLFDRANDDRDVVDRTQACRRLLGCCHGRYSPHTDRRPLATSPSVTLASMHARMRGRRFSVPAAASERSSSAASAKAWSRTPRIARVRSTWRRSVSGSMRCGSGRWAAPSVKAFTPTTTCSRASIARWAA